MPKWEKSFRAVLKNMLFSTESQEIKQNLEQLGHKALNIWSIKQNRQRNCYHYS